MHEYAEKNRLSIIAIATDIDHVHIFAPAPPRYFPAWIANLLKGISQECAEKIKMHAASNTTILFGMPSCVP